MHDRPAHDFRYSVSIAKFKRIGSKIEFNNFEKNLDTTIKWYILNRKWVEKTLIRSGYKGDRLGTNW